MAFTFASAAQGLQSLKRLFEERLPTLQDRAHLAPTYIDSRIWMSPPGEDGVAFLHVTVREQLLTPLDMALRYRIDGTGQVTLRRDAPGVVKYWASDPSTVYLPLVQAWVDGLRSRTATPFS